MTHTCSDAMRWYKRVVVTVGTSIPVLVSYGGHEKTIQTVRDKNNETAKDNFCNSQ